jgi:membrane-associated protein
MWQVFQSIVDAVSGSDWSYLIVFVIAMLDAFFPVVPSEATAIAAGVVAGAGGLSVELCILAAALGAFVGDNISYGGGHFLGERLQRRFFAGEKAKKRLDWADRTLRERGWYLIIVARFIPGGRTAVTFSSGYTKGISYRRFLLADAIAAAIWGSYAALLGYIGGRQFEEQPWKGLLAAFVIAISLALLVELVRHKREQRRSADPKPAPDEA